MNRNILLLPKTTFSFTSTNFPSAETITIIPPQSLNIDTLQAKEVIQAEVATGAAPYMEASNATSGVPAFSDLIITFTQATTAATYSISISADLILKMN